MEGYWSWCSVFGESSWHEATSKDKETCWNYKEDFGREGEGLDKVGIITYKALGSLGSASLKVFAAKWRLAWVSLRGSPWGWE